LVNSGLDLTHLPSLPSLTQLYGSLSGSATSSGTLQQIGNTVVLPGPLEKIQPSGTSTQSPLVAPAPIVIGSTPTQVQTVQPTPPASTSSASTLTVSGIIAQTNKQRRGQSAATLAESSRLDASAQVKADDILRRQYFEHTAPGGKTVSDLVAAQGYQYIKIGENLALGDFSSDEDVVTAWMNSPGHRANILDSAYTEMGVGVAFGMYQGHMVSVAVQHFGRPLSTCPTVEPGLKTEVETDQANLTTLAASLDSLKKSIDQGTVQGQNMDSTITVYNQGVEKYKTQFAAVEVLRQKYNTEVTAFNSCAS
jgi:uncharacterized protein YkwD